MKIGENIKARKTKTTRKVVIAMQCIFRSLDIRQSFWALITYLALRSSGPLWNNGSRFRQRTRSAAIVSFSLQLTPLACRSSLTVDRQVFLGRPFFLLPSAGVHSIARRAERSCAIRMTWPANQNPLQCSAVVSVPYVLRTLLIYRYKLTTVLTLGLFTTRNIFLK